MKQNFVLAKRELLLRNGIAFILFLSLSLSLSFSRSFTSHAVYASDDRGSRAHFEAGTLHRSVIYTKIIISWKG